MASVIYITGVHCSGKAAIAAQVAKRLNWRVIPREARQKLFDEALLQELEQGRSSASSALHARVHTRMRQSLAEWRRHGRLCEQETNSNYLSDRSPLDAVCYRNALRQLGWLDFTNCDVCTALERKAVAATRDSAGVFVDPSDRALIAEFQKRGMHHQNPIEHRNRVLLVSAEQFRREYQIVSERSSRWPRSSSRSVAAIISRTLALKAAMVPTGRATSLT